MYIWNEYGNSFLADAKCIFEIDFMIRIRELRSPSVALRTYIKYIERLAIYYSAVGGGAENRKPSIRIIRGLYCDSICFSISLQE